ncbi:CGNR zinc finger domain-containing protein [Actinokineospora auranticolor]|uniref:Putative RNA-binding Zn ribbon-like protein n=1 Tax=Actinokineospora auranticolor TaxID=155976 RepID=A0A2S6GT42_9PSEU|nr:CGNR zinc finger domain-containing protein [Actinokineospora auranticolor]PPK68291.1 putative RNA-binding Zn ribbon-like protein [Actinokineospora auranticolor]
MTEPPAPATALLEFANTLDLETGADALTTPAALGRWLLESGLLREPHAAHPRDHATALRLRAGIRELAGGGGTAGLEGALRDLPLRASTAPGVLVPHGNPPPVRAALARLAADLATVLITGEAARVKRCDARECGWLYWDSSRNTSRRWCSMRVCGNRAKARRHRALSPRVGSI